MPPTEEYVLFDAGVLIGALTTGGVASIRSIFTLDAGDWESIEDVGTSVAGPATTLARLERD